MKPKIEEIQKIAELISENFPRKDLSNLTIQFELPPIDLKKLDEELFYRNDGRRDNYELSDIVLLKVGNVNFKFIAEKKDAE